MAIARSHLFSQLSGSVGGTTYFWNRYGSIVIRTRVVPVDPNTPAQQTVRTRMSASVAAWQGLTQAQRDAWKDYADMTPWHNALGDDVHLAGSQMYHAIRLAALQIDNTIPVATFNLPQCQPGLLSQAFVSFAPCTSGVMQQGFQIHIQNNHPTSTIKVGIQRSNAQNTSINFWKGPYDTRNYQVIGPIGPGFGLGTDIVGLFAGKRYFMRFRSLDVISNNLVSSPWHGSADAAFCAS